MDILIWGCNRFAKLLCELLADTSVQVIGFVDENDLTEFAGKPVFNPNKLSASTLPIVVAVDHYLFFKRPILRFKAINEFKAKLQEISQHYPLSNQLLHPAALVDLLDLRFPNKVILFGMQGAGNVLFVNIFQRIFKHYLPFLLTRNKRSAFFELMCREYMTITQQVITDTLHLQGANDVHAVAWKCGTSHFNYRFGNEADSSLYTFNTREHIFSFVSMYHQIPSEAYLDKLAKMQFKLYFVMRNPLDMILSGVKKSGGIHNDKMDTDTFKCITRWVIDQHHAWYSRVAKLKTLSYEALLANPIKTITQLMLQLYLLPSGLLARRIWKQSAYQQLPLSFKNHFWQGGRGKWETYFKVEHLQYLKAYGVEDILQKYGYKQELQRFQALTASLPLITIDTHEKTYYHDEHYPTLTFLQATNGAQYCVETKNLYLVCKDEARRNSMIAVLDNSYLNTLITAGATDATRIR